MTVQRKALILIVFLLAACRTSTPVTTAPPAAGPATAAPSDARQTHELLNSVLWIQASTEYRASCIGTFVAAQRMLDRALEDPKWSAALEQQGDPSALPPAVIVDVDETVLDNAAYEVRLIRTGTSYGSKTWNAFVNEAVSTAVPGAVEFAKYAASRNVTIFYVTNRNAETEEGTRRNLEAVGFPIPAQPDVLLTRNERPEWASDKSSRRAEVASKYRVLLLIGDNLGDFIADESLPLQQRLATADTYRQFWGTRWFMIPNPMYGTWEAAVLGHERGIPDEEQLRRKLQALDAKD